MKKTAAVTKKVLPTSAPHPRTFRAFLLSQAESNWRADSDIANQRMFVLRNNPTVTIPSSQTKLLAWLSGLNRISSQALQLAQIPSNTQSAWRIFAIKSLVRRSRLQLLRPMLSLLLRNGMITRDLDAKERQDCRIALEVLHNWIEYENASERRARKHARTELYNCFAGTRGPYNCPWRWHFSTAPVWLPLPNPFFSIIKVAVTVACKTGNRAYGLDASFPRWDP